MENKTTCLNCGTVYAGFGACPKCGVNPVSSDTEDRANTGKKEPPYSISVA